MAVVTLDDGTARVEATVYNEVLEAALDKVIEDRIVIVEGECKVDDVSGEHGLNAQRLLSIDDLRGQHARSLILQVKDSAFEELLALLQSVLTEKSATGCQVAIDYERAGARARLKLGDEWRVRATDQLLDQFHRRLGEGAVSIEY